PTMVGALSQFVIGGLLALLLLALVGGLALRHIAEQQALRQAQDMTLVQAQSMQPRLTDGLIRGDHYDLARFDRRVRAAVLNDRVVRIKVWTADGKVVYSEDPALIGQRFALAEDQQDVFRTGVPSSDVSNQTAAENAYDHPDGRVLEVYQRVESESGVPLLFESYLRYNNVIASSAGIWRAFAPALLVGFATLYLMQLPIAWRLIRRLQRGQRERDVLEERAAHASDLARQRIVADLHDGVVQTLAGVSYSLAAVAQRAKTQAPELSQTICDAGDSTRRSIVQLRTLISDIYPASLRHAGLGAALHDLLDPLKAQGITPELSVPAALAVSEEVEDVLYRSAQEAIRNVVKHADTERVDVVVKATGDRVSLHVRDEGKGFAPLNGLQKDGHFGLRLLSERIAQMGGLFEVDSVPGQGTVVKVEVPNTPAALPAARADGWFRTPPMQHPEGEPAARGSAPGRSHRDGSARSRRQHDERLWWGRRLRQVSLRRSKQPLQRPTWAPPSAE
ncbi:MAG: two-component system, NarL family, sensor kinase, partial [Frankiaceae bacterium]|nr:two-component system, NarL family, sensor kinase [Frankiaceae bacterium]